jgi:hypothetical protein
MTELVFRTTFGTLVFSFASNASTNTVKPVPTYAGTTCHRVPSNRACTKTTQAGNNLLPKMRFFVSIRCSSAPAFGKEETEDLNALFADIVEATHKSGSKGLFKGFRKKWNSFIATLNTCATILLLLFLPVLCSLAVSYALKMMMKPLYIKRLEY